MSEQKKKRLPKTHKDYWKQRVEKLSYKDADGQKIESGEYSIRLSHQGKREYFPLNTSNLATAATKAKKIYTYISANGMDAALAEFKPKEEVPDVSTVGELIAAAEKTADIAPRTMRDYATALRKVGGDITNVKANAKDRFRPGGGEWQKKTDKVKLAAFTPDALKTWKIKQTHGLDPVEAGRKKRSAETVFGRIRSIWKYCNLPNPLEGEKWKTQSAPFEMNIEGGTLLYYANKELEKQQPEQYKAFMLCLFLGLRKKEADNLTWEQIKFEDSQVHIKTTEHFKLKREESERKVDIDESFLPVLSSWRDGADKVFVLSGGESKPLAKYPYYRADIKLKTWRKLIAWIKAKGVTAKNPMHYLRKLAGANIYEQLGEYAAQRYLGHSDIRTTTTHYVKPKTGAAAFTPKKPEPKAVGN